MSLYYPKKSFNNLKELQLRNNTLAVTGLFGDRFFSDQTPFEILSEFLLVASSEKRIEHSPSNLSTKNYILPEDFILAADEGGLSYYPSARLYLKLFSILQNSDEQPPHKVHREEADKLAEDFKKKVVIPSNPSLSKDKVFEILSNLFIGFQGIGSNRDWCAQSFLPLCRELLSAESIWKKNNAKKKGDSIDWKEALPFFEHTGHVFYARGGEILYLQLMAVLSKSEKEILTWIEDPQSGIKDCYRPDSCDPTVMSNELNLGFQTLLETSCPKMIGRLSDFIEEIGEEGTFNDSEYKKEIKIDMGFIPSDCWKDGFLFAQDLIHIFKSKYNQIDTLNMLQIACAFQVLRTMQRKCLEYSKQHGLKDSFQYIAVIDPETNDTTLRNISNRSLKEIQLGIARVINDNYDHPCNGRAPSKDLLKDKESKIKKLNSSYGDKLFLKYCKIIGFVVPKKGGMEHFVLDKNLLSFLVSSTLLPGQKMSLDSFLEQLKKRFGLVFTNEGLNLIKTEKVASQKVLVSEPEEWLIRMLDESGYLIPLADSFALVENTANPKI